MENYKKIAAGFVLAAGLGWLYKEQILVINWDSWGTGPKLISESRVMMGMPINVTLVGNDKKKAAQDIGKVYAEMARLDQVFSNYRADSEISRINRLAGQEEVVTTSEVIQVITEALQVSKMTNGAFDISVSPLLSIWGFYSNDHHVPSEDLINKTKALVDYRNIILDGKKNSIRFKKAGMAVDSGGIAKKYILRRSGEVVKSLGYRDALIDISGDVWAMGHRSDGKEWRVGIQHPRDKAKNISFVDVSDYFVLTSGDYERKFIKGNQLFSHEINPKAGAPSVETASVTLLIPDSAPWIFPSLAVALLAPNDGLKLVEKIEKADAIIIDKNMQVHLSKRLEGKIAIHL